MNSRLKKILFVAVPLLLVVGFAVFTQRKPQREITTQKPISNTSYQGNETGAIKYIGPIITPPQKMGLYKNSQISLYDQAKEIATKLNLTQSSYSEDVWSNKDKKESIIVDVFNNIVQYSIDATEIQAKGSKPKLEPSVVEAMAFLKNLNLSKNLDPKPKTVNYYKGNELNPTTPEDAEVIEMFFEQKLEGFQISIDKYTFSDIAILAGSDNKIIKAIFPPRLSPTEKVKEQSTIDFQTVVQSVEKGKGDIVDISIENEGRQTKQIPVKDIKLESAALEFRLSEKDNVFYPYYRFDGKTTVKHSGKNAFITIIFPAVEI